jgi:GAF domain-containing protein
MKSQHFLGLKILRQKEYTSLLVKLEQAEIHEREALDYLETIEAGNFKITPELKSNGHSSNVLKKISAFQEAMSTLVRTAEETRWHDAGMARFNEILTHSFNDQQELYDQIVSQLAKYLNANQAAIFLINEKSESETGIRLEACYAYQRKKFVQRDFSLGEGLVGQSIQEKNTIFMTNVPDHYTKITSGLGEATPGCILITPLIDESNVVGALELASFRKFNSSEITFVESLSRIITACINNIRQNQQLKKLYKTSESAKAEIREKEEELRQQMEELQASNEELNRKSAELERLSSELERKNLEIADIQKQDKELLESKLETQRKSYEMIIDRLKMKLQTQNLKQPT